MTENHAEQPPERVVTLGHNQPPWELIMRDLVDQLPDYLDGNLADIFKRAAELEAAFARTPEITNQDLAGKVSDFVAQINACTKAAESKRTDLVAGALAAQRTINSILDKKVFDLLDTPKGQTGIKQKLLARLTDWERKKAEQERLRRLEQERIAREEADRKAREAAEVQRKAREAEEAERRRREEEDRKCREAEAAERQRKEAEERKIREAEEARIAKIENEAQMKRELAKQERLRQERELREAQEAEARAKREEEERLRREADDRRAAEERARREHEAKVAEEAADKARADLAQAEKASDAKAASLHTVRGDYGSSSSLRTVAKGFITNRNDLIADPTIHPFITDDVLEKAVNAYVKLHKMKGKLAGVDIREVTDAVVRG